MTLIRTFDIIRGCGSTCSSGCGCRLDSSGGLQVLDDLGGGGGQSVRIRDLDG